MSEAVEQGCGHFGIAKNARPFAKCEICRNDHRSAFVEAVDGLEQQLSADLGEVKWTPLSGPPGPGLKVEAASS